MENQLKDMLLKLFINRVSTGKVDEIKSLAVDILLNPDLDKDKLGLKFFHLSSEYHGRDIKALERIKKSNRHLYHMDIDKTYQICNEDKSNYVAYYKELEVIDVDVFREQRFACKDLLTGEIIYFDTIKPADTDSFVHNLFVEEEVKDIQEQIVKSVEIDSILESEDKLEN